MQFAKPGLTCAAPSFQLVLLGVCLGEGLAGVDSLKASFQSRNGKELDMLMLPSGVPAGGISSVEGIEAVTVPSRLSKVTFVVLCDCVVTQRLVLYTRYAEHVCLVNIVRGAECTICDLRKTVHHAVDRSLPACGNVLIKPSQPDVTTFVVGARTDDDAHATTT